MKNRSIKYQTNFYLTNIIKRLFLTGTIILLSLISFACQEDFNPISSDYKQQYVVNGIISYYYKYYNYNRFRQEGCECRVFISKSFNLVNNMAMIDSGNVLIRGAKVALELDAKNTFYLTDKDSKGNQLNYYAVKITKDIQGRQLRLSVTTPDGMTLSSQTTLPFSITPALEAAESFEFGITPRINQDKWGKGATFVWNPKQNVHVIFAKLVIPYRIISQDKYSEIEVPVAVAKRNSGAEYVYPQPFSGDHITFDFSALDSALSTLGRENPDKSDIELINCMLSLRSYDKELSAFYSTTNGYLDQYSLRLDENVYSNIEGGLGIFGSYSTSTYDFPLDARYIKSFGYTYYSPFNSENNKSKN